LLKLTAQSFREEDFLRRPQRPSVLRRAMTHLQETLRQFTLENRRKRQLYRNPTALSRHLTFALAVLCSRKEKLATENSSSAVHKLWRTELPCGKPRKSGRKYSRLEKGEDRPRSR